MLLIFVSIINFQRYSHIINDAIKTVNNTNFMSDFVTNVVNCCARDVFSKIGNVCSSILCRLGTDTIII